MNNCHNAELNAYLGVDIGTSSIAVVAIDFCGRILNSATVPNPSLCEPAEDGRHEQDADAILETVNKLIADCESAIFNSKRKSVGIGWTGQMHGLVAVDKNLKPLTPFVTWRDRRCAPPKFSVGILDDWRIRKIKGIYRVLTIPGYAIARRTGRCSVDRTFFAAMGIEKELARYEKWIPEMDDTQMLGDNQAGVYAALKMHPDAAVVNLGTSGQLSRVVEKIEGVVNPSVSVRPFPDDRMLLCRASHLGGAPLAKLRLELGYSWERLNDEAGAHPLIAGCIKDIVDDLADGFDMKGVGTVVGVGNALRLNPCLKTALERCLGVRCVIPEVKEMAAWGAALYALDQITFDHR